MNFFKKNLNKQNLELLSAVSVTCLLPLAAVVATVFNGAQKPETFADQKTSRPITIRRL
jgi:hypothetical protein